MSNADPQNNDAERRNTAAAAWVLRVDRGLTPGEQDELSDWLAADPLNQQALKDNRRHWQRLDRLSQWIPADGPVPNADLLAPPPPRPFWRKAPFAWAAAAVLALGAGSFSWSLRNATPAALVVSSSAPGGHQLLADGSNVELNRDTEISSVFQAQERRVRLVRGEAHFVVAKDETRPFIVQANGVEVRAVGTVFNVRIGNNALEVLVTEGKVQVTTPASAGTAPSTGTDSGKTAFLEPRQRALVHFSHEGAAPEIATLTVGEIERVLGWHHAELDLTDAPLSDVVAEFNQRNVVQMTIVDPSLAAIRVTATFRTDNLNGFLKLLEAGFSVQVERRSETDLVLRRQSAADSR